MFSTHNPDAILESLLEYAEVKGRDLKLSDNKYKLRLTLIKDRSPEDETPAIAKAKENTAEGEDAVELTINILKADSSKYCIEFIKNGGDALLFFEKFEEIKDYIGELIDTTY